MTAFSKTRDESQATRVFVWIMDEGKQALIIETAKSEGIEHAAAKPFGVSLSGERQAIDQALRKAGKLTSGFDALRLKALVDLLEGVEIEPSFELYLKAKTAWDLAAEGDVETFCIDSWERDNEG